MRDPAVESAYIGADGQYVYARNAIKRVGGGPPVASKPSGAAEVPLNRHLILIPEAKLLVIMSRDKTKLIVRKLPI